MSNTEDIHTSGGHFSTANEFNYLYDLICYRVRESFPKESLVKIEPGHESEPEPEPEPAWPSVEDWQPCLKEFVEKELVKDGVLEQDKAVVLLIGLAPYLYPDLFDTAIMSELPEGTKDFMKIGGARGHN